MRVSALLVIFVMVLASSTLVSAQSSSFWSDIPAFLNAYPVFVVGAGAPQEDRDAAGVWHFSQVQ